MKIRVYKEDNGQWIAGWYSPVVGAVMYAFSTFDNAILTADAIANR